MAIIRKASITKAFLPLFELKGNPRYAVFTEPLWGIPHTLYAPFLTLYMFSLGVEDANIGILVAVGMIVQMVASVFSGVLTDKFGRRKTNLVWDHLAWTVPCLIWAFAQDFRWFLAAALFNGLWPIGSNAWECLLVEDAEPNKIVQLFNWIYIAGLLAVFVAPISGILIGNLGLIPVMRVLLVFAVVSMSAKFILHFHFSKETQQGLVRLNETVGVPVSRLLLQYKGVLSQIFTTPATKRVLLLVIVLHIQQIISTTFLPLYITLDLGLPEQYLPWLTVVLRGAIMLSFFLVFQRILDRYSIHIVMLGGLVLYVGGYVLLLSIPAGVLLPFQGDYAPAATLLTIAVAALPLIIFTAIDACAAAVFLPRRDTLVIQNVDPAERARIRAMLMAIMLGAASPFGLVAGRLSGIDRRIPFMACLGLFLIMGIIVCMERRRGNETNQRATA